MDMGQASPPTVNIMTGFTSLLAEAEVLLAPTSDGLVWKGNLGQDCEDSVPVPHFEDTRLGNWRRQGVDSL